MLNTYTSNPTAKININSVSGLLNKTLKDSYFVRFHMRSALSDRLFCDNNKTVILQIMLCQDGELIAEVIDRNKYEQMFKEGETE